jgi:uncharacterized membrane protein
MSFRLIPFLVQLDDDRIVAAIHAAERMTSGEVRVFIADRKAPDPVPAAIEHFERMGMTATAQRNGVLLYVAPLSHTFAIVADREAHARCGGDATWSRICDEMRSRFAEEPTSAIVHGVMRIGEALSPHFPRMADDRNELPDRIERG